MWRISIFRLRSKPREPRKKLIRESITLNYGDSLGQVLRRIPHDVDLDDVEMTYEHNYYDDQTVILEWQRWETDEEFQIKYDTYLSRLNSYEKWYAENETAIKEELLRREKLEAEKDRRRQEKAKKAAEVQLKKAQKRVQALEAKLNASNSSR